MSLLSHQSALPAQEVQTRDDLSPRFSVRKFSRLTSRSGSKSLQNWQRQKTPNIQASLDHEITLLILSHMFARLDFHQLRKIRTIDRSASPPPKEQSRKHRCSRSIPPMLNVRRFASPTRHCQAAINGTGEVIEVLLSSRLACCLYD